MDSSFQEKIKNSERKLVQSLNDIDDNQVSMKNLNSKIKASAQKIKELEKEQN